MSPDCIFLDLQQEEEIQQRKNTAINDATKLHRLMLQKNKYMA